MIVALWAALAMGAQDLIATVEVVAEARGRAIVAGLLDVISDAAKLAAMGIGIGTIQAHGFSTITVLTLLAMFSASFLATTAGTVIGQRLHQEER